MIRGASIVCLSLIDWSFNRQFPQEVAQAFAAAGNRVLFVENTGVRRAALRDASRLWFRLRNWWRAPGRTWSAGRGIDVLSPLLLPLPASRAATGLNTRVLVRSVRRWMDHEPRPLIIVTFSPTPLARSVIRSLGPDLVVYYCVDLLAESSPAAWHVKLSERALLAEADLVLVSSGLLQRMAAEISPHVELLEGGVHVEDFVRARRSRAEAHQGFPACSGSIVGFVGSFRSATDLDLLVRSAELAPDLQFVLAGPRFVDVSALERLPNVHLLDAIPHAEVAHFMARFDVASLPYVINSFTAAILPAKLKEYLAAGLPMVATSIPEVRRFDERHPGLVRFADDPAAFVLALRDALAHDTPEMAAHRIAVSRQYDWGRQMSRMDALMAEALSRRRPLLPPLLFRGATARAPGCRSTPKEDPSVIKRLIRRTLRRMGYDILKVPATEVATPVSEPPAVAPAWPLPRRNQRMTDEEVRREFARFPFWHYAYEFDGGLSFPTSQRNPGLDTDDPRRPLQRFRHFMPYLVEAEGGSLQGKRVLDIACNSGFWSLQCALLGAEVVGFDARAELIDQANLLKRVTGVEDVDFRVLDFREMNPTALGGTFDVVLNLGFLYHVPEPLEALELTRAMAHRHILLDTAVHPSDEMAVYLRWEEPFDIRAAVDAGMVAFSTKSGIELMLRHLRVKRTCEIPVRTNDLPLDYLTSKRAAWLIEV